MLIHNNVYQRVSYLFSPISHHFLVLLAVAILRWDEAGPRAWFPPPAPILNIDPPAPAAGGWAGTAPNCGGDVAPKLGAGAPAPNVGAGAANVELDDPPPKGLALGAGPVEPAAPPPKLKTPAGAGGL